MVLTVRVIMRTMRMVMTMMRMMMMMPHPSRHLVGAGLAIMQVENYGGKTH